MAFIDRRSGLLGTVAIKAPCRVATTENITLAELQTIDGVALAEGDRVLVRAQDNGVENGVYVAETGTWQRAIDFNGPRDVVSGTIGIIQSGTTYAGQMWRLVTTDPVIGTTALVFSIAIITGNGTIESFGAVGDGVTDDSAAFALAVLGSAAIQLDGSKTYAVKNVIVAADAVCPGIFALGGQARLVPPAGSTSSDYFFIVRKLDGFSFENIFFDMPFTGSEIDDPDFSKAVWLAPTGGRGSNYRVEDCKFSGGSNAINSVGSTIENSRIARNYITGTYGDGMSLNACINTEIVDNVLEDTGIASGGGVVSGAIRAGGSTQIDTSLNLTIARNIISLCCVASGQSAIDCFSGAARNIRITDNICSYNGAGIELKTMIWTPASPGAPFGAPDVYEDNVVSNNTIRLLSSASTNAITVFHAVSGSAKGKAEYVQICGNMITCNPPVAANTYTHYGISVAGHDYVTIDSNTIIGTGHGIAVGGTGPVGNTADHIVISNNTVDAVEFAFNHANGTLNNLYIRNNPLLRNGATATSPAVVIQLPGTDIDVSGNRIESLAVSALELREVTNARVTDNTLIGAVSAIVMQGTAVAGVKVRDNELVATAGPACNLSTGSGIEVQGNNIDVPIGSYTVSGAATYTAAGNIRGLAAADPTATAGGALGDIFLDSTAATGGWRCTTAGAAGVAVFTAI